MSRPFVLLNVAATADGKIDTFQRRGASISSEADKQRVDQLRAGVDAVMVGSRTLHAEDPRLTVKSEQLRAERQARGLSPNPAKVAMASRLELKPDCRFLSAGPAPIILFTTSQTAPGQLSMLRECGAQVHVMDGARPHLPTSLRLLNEHGIQRLMVEGGATINFAMLSAGLVDELFVYVAPLIFGGESAPTLAGGLGLPADQSIRLHLLDSEPLPDGAVILHYELRK
jgi:2,5-diamino-6-(ribosylamino)-4(3H)-pyrimidinone 5'-phosphate reductase